MSTARSSVPADRRNLTTLADQRRLTARVQAAVGGVFGQTDRWRTLVDRIAPGLAEDPDWPALARALTRAADAGYDVGTRLPELIRRVRYPRRTRPDPSTTGSSTPAPRRSS